jgi:hypothetical protein
VAATTIAIEAPTRLFMGVSVVHTVAGEDEEFCVQVTPDGVTPHQAVRLDRPQAEKVRDALTTLLDGHDEH